MCITPYTDNTQLTVRDLTAHIYICLWNVACGMWYKVCGVVSGTWWVECTVWDVPDGTESVLCVCSMYTCYVVCGTCYVLCVMCYVSCVMWSCVTRPENWGRWHVTGQYEGNRQTGDTGGWAGERPVGED